MIGHLSETLRMTPRGFLRRFPWWVVVLIGVMSVGRWSALSLVLRSMLLAGLIGWTAFLPRRVLVDADGFVVKRVAARTLCVRWADVQRFGVDFTRGQRWASWYVNGQKPQRLWSTPKGVIAPVLAQPGETRVMSAEELVAWLDDRRVRALGASGWAADIRAYRKRSGRKSDEGDPFETGKL